VREICARAEANVAAVNYHFRDKAGLYAEVVKYAYQYAIEKYPFSQDVHLAPDQKLLNFIETFLQRILDRGRPSWHGKLMSREMTEPTSALDQMIENAINPTFAVLRPIVREIIGQDKSELQVRLCVSSIVGQCVLYHHCREVVYRLSPDLEYTGEFIKQLANHICSFSLAGLQAIAGEKENAENDDW
jgi:TetR/AcrR family transcriptional regulator, regulator of cefoperazone and chloramphenicol sensitivity